MKRKPFIVTIPYVDDEYIEMVLGWVIDNLDGRVRIVIVDDYYDGGDDGCSLASYRQDLVIKKHRIEYLMARINYSSSDYHSFIFKFSDDACIFTLCFGSVDPELDKRLKIKLRIDS